MKKNLLFIPLVILFSSVVFGYAEDVPIDIKADDLRFNEKSGLIEAVGSVEVKFKQATIRADRMIMDGDTNIATAEGRVYLFSSEYNASADELTFDASKEISSFKQFESRINAKGINGSLFMKAKCLLDENKVMKGGPGQITSCDKAVPHYFMTAEKVEYYPNDRIEGKNVCIYIGKLPVFWFPYARYDFNSRGRKNWVFGHNAVEGDFIKTTWELWGGSLLLDYMQKKGLGYGIDKKYASAFGLGSYYLYHLDETDTAKSDWVWKIENENKLNPDTTLKLYQRYTDIYIIPSGRLSQTALGFNLNHAGKNRWNMKFDSLDDRAGGYQDNSLSCNLSAGSLAVNYSTNYNFGKYNPAWLQNDQRLDFRLPVLANRVALSGGANYYHSTTAEGDSGREKIEPKIELSGSEKIFSWRLTQNWFIDLKKDIYSNDPQYEYLEKQPEIEIYPQALDLKLFTLSSTLGYGNYREVKTVAGLPFKRDFRAGRSRAALSAAKSFPLGSSTSLNIGLGIDQFAYSTEDQMYAYRESAALVSNFKSTLFNELSYRKGYTQGNTPFFFDKLETAYNDIKDRLTLSCADKFSFSLEGGRNWQTEKWFDVMGNLKASPDKRVRVALNGGWDVENTRYKDFISSLQVNPSSAFSLGFAAVQDINAGEFRSASVLYDLVLLQGQPNQWHIKVGQVYDASNRDFKVRDIMVVKDLHCWEIKAYYSDYLKETSVIFSLKALPDQPFGFSPSRGFYFEGFQKLENEVKKIQTQGPVNRF